ncbi:MAG: sulfite exporter TauE/SafE family protein [Bythopirellula sp.]
MTFALSIAFGGIVGFALGLTGGGGSLLAVPLLVYGLSIAPREAIGISLAAVGVTALLGVVPRWRSGQVEAGTGLLFALAGMVGAPLGTWVAALIPEAFLLTLFALLMLSIATRMWINEPGTQPTSAIATICERSESGQLQLTTPCAIILLSVGVLTGFLSGMFGVGGGFVIVPALVLFSQMPIHRAVATSLLVIVLVSLSGVTSHVVAGRGIAWDVTGLFVAGGFLGMLLGGRFSEKISGPRLQKVFAAGIVIVASWILAKSLT